MQAALFSLCGPEKKYNTNQKGRVMNIAELIKDLDAALEAAWNEYIELHEKFDTYRGRELTIEEVARANELCVDIQKKFKEMFPAYTFVSEKHIHAVKACSTYEDWILDLKQQGALQDNKERLH